MSAFDLIGIALVFTIIMLLGYVTTSHKRCTDAGGTPINGQCVALPLVDMEKSPKKS